MYVLGWPLEMKVQNNLVAAFQSIPIMKKTLFAKKYLQLVNI